VPRELIVFANHTIGGHGYNGGDAHELKSWLGMSALYG
jgi:hypothetical protein